MPPLAERSPGWPTADSQIVVVVRPLSERAYGVAGVDPERGVDATAAQVDLAFPVAGAAQLYQTELIGADSEVLAGSPLSPLALAFEPLALPDRPVIVRHWHSRRWPGESGYRRRNRRAHSEFPFQSQVVAAASVASKVVSAVSV